MYKIVIVEDEYYIRKSLVNLIQWKDIDCTVVASFESGEMAIEYLAKENVDIVISDIKMNGISGVELAAILAERYTDIRVIFLTGHAEFEYARAAVRLNVMDFILKPTDPLELTNSVKKASLAIEKKRQRAITLKKYRMQVTENIPILQSQFLSDLIHGLLSSAESNSMALSLGIPDTPFFVVCAGIDGCSELQSSRSEEELQMMRNGLFQTGLGYREGFVWGLVFNPWSLVFVFHGKDVDAYCHTLIDLSKDVFSVSLSLGVSRLGDIFSSFLDYFYQACDALHSRYFLSDRSIIHYDGESKLKDISLHSMLSLLEEYLETGNEDGAVSTLGRICSLLVLGEPDSISYMRNIILEIIVLTQKVALHNGLEYLIDSKLEMIREVEGKENLKDLEDFACSIIRDGCNKICELNGQKRKTVAGKIIDYLEENYSHAVSLEEVGAAVFRSSKYICKILKQETGRHFSEILVSLRMEKAVDLLRNTDRPISEIASMVGIQDPHYFSKVFKKYFGISPTKYRDRR